MRSFFLFPLLAVLGVATPLYEVVILNHRPSTTALSSNGHYATGNFTPYVVHQPTGITSFLSSVTGTTWVDALGVNSSGVVVGQSMNSRALIWDGTTLQTYLPGTSVQSVAWGINDADMIVGAALIPGGGGGWRLFRYDRATNTVEIRSEESTGYAINAAGDAAGSGRNGGVREAAIVTGPLGSGTFQFLGQAPGGTASVARGISSNGLVVGEGNSSTTANAVIYWPSPGSPIELDRLGQPWARAGGVNAAGQIVGGIGGGSMGTTGILWDGLTPYVLANLIQNNTGWKLDYAAAINDAGQILAIGSLNGIPAVVRLDPVGVPEPSTALLALGAGAVLFWRRWRC